MCRMAFRLESFQPQREPSNEQKEQKEQEEQKEQQEQEECVEDQEHLEVCKGFSELWDGPSHRGITSKIFYESLE